MKSICITAVVGLLLSICTAQAQPGQSVQPFNGKDLSGWKVVKAKDENDKASWTVGTASLDPANPKLLKVEQGGSELINATAWGKSKDLYSDQKFGDCTVEVDVMVPKDSNSGIYLMGEYEVQVLDSFGKPNDKLTQGDMGAIYSAAAPKVNASKKPGEWQRYVIEFRAPRFDAAGKKTENAKFIKITLNDQVVQENVEVKKGSTGGGVTGKEHAEGPLMFQGNHGPVAFRNLKITPAAAAAK